MLWVAAALVVGALAAMASGRIDPLLALLVALVLAAIIGVAPVNELASGLSNPGVITIAAMLVIARGIVQTGVVSRATWALLASTTTAQQVFRRLAVPIGLGSALINTTPLVAMLIPAARQLEQTKRIPAREVLLPIAHVTTLAGSVTLIGTSSNLVIAGIAGERGVDMGMLSFAAVALPVALVGAVVTYLTGRRALRGAVDTAARSQDWRVEIRVNTPARAEHRRATTLGIDRTQEYELVGIERWGTTLGPQERIEAGDLLVFNATEEGIAALWATPLFGTSAQRLYAVSVGAGEPVSLHELERDGSLRIIAARSDRPLHETDLSPGETCYVTGESEEAVARSPAVALWQRATSRAPQPSKTLVALGVLLCVVIAASFGLVAAEVAAAGGAVLMVLTGVITPRSAARALEPRVLALLAASIGLGAIVVESGLADVISDAIADLSDGTLGLVLVLAVATTVTTNLVTNAATAAIVTPVALSLADELGADPVLVLALVGTCVSFTLINPYSHQSNLMVLQPGGYSEAQFARFGVPILAACLVTACGFAVLWLSA
ncbi:SLC13 family permease [Solirubrobacter sp. CPCC 204708]|uniref:SLC13 family permease n=1 Tax=Solirubrobacter deserti TaxID=2282478 RepID=A0ABT4RIQ3_9ACTN|nr:SLC13 family permease [Solirubrobacter deserti]MBE2318795.1 SLC13 family permease [Solirubrobacter deserti]MDA0138175.1 SLC13 family permease [Solirubrobacter deserti]